MAKPTKVEVKLESTLGTGVFYVATKSAKKTEKLEVNKYDKKARKHGKFIEKKIK